MIWINRIRLASEPKHVGAGPETALPGG